MDQEKIGKFIQELRKEKGITQRELAELLGVSNRAVSKWENGSSMPDLSLFKPLSKELDVTINELFDGKRNDNKVSDDHIINTIDIADKKYSTDVIGYLIYKVLGIFLLIISYSFMHIDHFFPTIWLIIGGIFIIVSGFKLTKNLRKSLKVIINILYIFLSVFIVFTIDNIHIINDSDGSTTPRLYIYKRDTEKYQYYSTLTGRYYYCKINKEIQLNSYVYYFDKESRIESEKNCILASNYNIKLYE